MANRTKRPLQLWLAPEVIVALKNQAWAAHIPTAEYCRRIIELHLEGITDTKTIVVEQPRVKTASRKSRGFIDRNEDAQRVAENVIVERVRKPRVPVWSAPVNGEEKE